MQSVLSTVQTPYSNSVLRIHHRNASLVHSLVFYLNPRWLRVATGVIVRPGQMITLAESHILAPLAEASNGHIYECDPLVDQPLWYANHHVGSASVWGVDPALPSVALAPTSDRLRVGDELTIYAHASLTWRQWWKRLLDPSYLLPAQVVKTKISRLVGAGERRRFIVEAPPWAGIAGAPAFDHDGRMVGMGVSSLYDERNAFMRIEGVHALLGKINRDL